MFSARLCDTHTLSLSLSLSRLFTSQVIAHTLVERNPTALHLARFHDREEIRSLQLYSTRPERLADAALIAIEELGVAHIDLNFGCPVKKVSRVVYV